MADLAVNGEMVRRLVERTRAIQGLPPRVTDSTALRRIAAVLVAAQKPSSTQRKDHPS